MDKLVQGVKAGLGFGDVGKKVGKRFEEDVVVSAPGKVILFGEHAVVHGVVSHYSNLRSLAESQFRPQ
jgi:hypothetical protein